MLISWEDKALLLPIKKEEIEEVVRADLFDLLFWLSSLKNSLVALIQHYSNQKELIDKLVVYFEEL